MSGIDLTAIHEIKELLVPIATSVTLLSVAISSWLALRQYRLKLRSEKIENDIKLVKAFSELMSLAHARSQTTYSEKFLDKLFEKEIISNADFQGFDLGRKIQTAALTVPIGLAAQTAAIAAVATLGLRHDVLKDASIQGLESLVGAVPQLQPVVAEHLQAARRSAVGYHLTKLKRWICRSK